MSTHFLFFFEFFFKESFFPSQGTIYPSDYSLKISVEVSKEGLDTEGIW